MSLITFLAKNVIKPWPVTTSPHNRLYTVHNAENFMTNPTPSHNSAMFSQNPAPADYQASPALQRILAANPAVLYAVSLKNNQLNQIWMSENVVELLGYSMDEVMKPS